MNAINFIKSGLSSFKEIEFGKYGFEITGESINPADPHIAFVIYTILALLFILLISLIILYLIGKRRKSHPKITQGEIIKKTVIPAGENTSFFQPFLGSDIGLSSILIPHEEKHSEKYEITIKSYSGDGKVNFATYEVSKEAYESYSVGEEFIFKNND